MNITPTSYSDCLKEMFALGRFGIKLELDTTVGILLKLGSPEKQFKTIHIAGTNGKGSIASYIASILKHSGIRTGLYTSPHLIRFNERFAVNGTMVSDGDVVEAYIAVKAADTGERKATFFEIATAMAFHIFARKGVEWAVIETGMGGRLDATNILQPELTIISNLSIEHTEYLGETLEEIAAEKAGIIKPAVPVITGVSQSQDSALAIIHDTAKRHAAPLFQFGRDFTAVELLNHNSETLDHAVEPLANESSANESSANKSFINNSTGNNTQSSTRFTYTGMDFTWQAMETRLLGPHQIHNAALALAACEVLLKKNQPSGETWNLSDDAPNLQDDGSNLQDNGSNLQDNGSNLKESLNGSLNGMTEKTIRKGLFATSWPGRLEYILLNPIVIIDGAHNLQAAKNLGRYLEEQKRTAQKCTDSITPTTSKFSSAASKYIFIIGILDDKPYRDMLTCLLPAADRIIFTKAKINRSFEPEILKNFAETISHADIEIMEDVGSAVAHALETASEKDCICIAGSLYVAGEARDKIQKDFLVKR